MTLLRAAIHHALRVTIGFTLGVGLFLFESVALGGPGPLFP